MSAAIATLLPGSHRLAPDALRVLGPAAIALGKALFWDMQAGSDGVASWPLAIAHRRPRMRIAAGFSMVGM